MHDAPPRVAIVARAVYPVHGYGGLERHVFDLVRHLARREVDVTLITKPFAGASIASFDALPEATRPRIVEVPYVTFPGAGRKWTTILDRDTAYLAFGYRAGRAALSLSARGRIDVVHGLGASVLGYAWARSREPNKTPPLVFNPQGLEEFGATDPARVRLKTLAYWPLQRAVRVCARAADCVIATDRALRPVVERHLSVSNDRIRVVPNAVDIEMCDDLAGPDDGLAMRQRAGMSRSTRLFLSVGRLEANKGFHVLAAALSKWAAMNAANRATSEWRWLVVGDGPYRQQLEAIIASNGIASQTTLVGRTSDRALHAWYEAADVFVHPTLYEGSSLVTLEAMTHRRAVIASAAGGLPDKVQPDVTGWLVPPGDAAALADALSRAVANPTLERLGAAGRELVERTFSWNAVAGQMIELYRELIARHPRPEGALKSV